MDQPINITLFNVSTRLDRKLAGQAVEDYLKTHPRYILFSDPPQIETITWGRARFDVRWADPINLEVLNLAIQVPADD